MASEKTIYDKLFITVEDYKRSKDRVDITYRLQYEEEETTLATFIEIEDQKTKSRKVKFFLDRGFDAIKKDIRDWVKTITDDESKKIVGRPYIFNPKTLIGD